jgi:hypothetical protein
MTEVSNKVQYTFFGKVHPERCMVSIPGLSAAVKTSDGEINGKLTYYISLSQITAILVCDKQVQNVLTLKNFVEDWVRIAVDALGYILACGYDIEITEMIDSLGNSPIVFGVVIPAVQDSAKNAGVTFDSIMKVFKDIQSGYLQLCLADLREAIRVPRNTGFFCYRAIESLRQFFVHEKGAKNDKASWEMLRSELDIDKSNIDMIKRLADPVRHGGSVAISDSERSEVFKLTWGIVNKFIIYANAEYKKS